MTRFFNIKIINMVIMWNIEAIHEKYTVMELHMNGPFIV
jgi:hypothetical protein